MVSRIHDISAAQQQPVNLDALLQAQNTARTTRKTDQPGPDAQAQAAAQTQQTAQTSPADYSPSGARDTRNAQILEASLQVSIQSGNDGLTLLYRTAVDSINKTLEPELGPNAIQQAAAQPQDYTPEATAGRIVSQSTAFFDAYAANHANEDPETVVNNFVSMIRGGFEQGYGEAKKILGDLGVMGDDSPVATGVATTYDLVQKGYDDFLNSKLAALRGDTGDASGASATASQTDAATQSTTAA